MTECPTREHLKAFLRGQVGNADGAALATHVEECERCIETLAVLSTDSELDQLYALVRDRESESRKLEQPFIRRLKEQPPSFDSSSGRKSSSESIPFPGAPTEKGPLGQIDHYHVAEEVGRGGMGVVYRAFDDQLKRWVAIKVLTPALAAVDSRRERFRKEASRAARVKHDHVVAIHEVNTASDFLPYIVMEWIDGDSLDSRLDRQGQFSDREAAVIVREISLGVAHAHKCGIVHRDIKPSNIMLDVERKRATITDFGLARDLEQNNDQHSRPGQIVGTPSYMSPEQIRSSQVGARSDVYSLGVVLYELLAGERPFRGVTNHDILMQIVHEEPSSPRRHNKKLPRDLETICLKCLQKDPHRRYASASLLADDLYRWLDGTPIRARPVGASERTWRWCRRNPTPASLSLAIVILIILSVLFTTSQWQSEKRQRELSEATTYFTTIGVAQHSWATGDIRRMKRLLDGIAKSPHRNWEWRYLQRLCNLNVYALKGHSPSSDEPNAEVFVFDVAYSRDGQFLATAGGGNLFYLEDNHIESGEVVLWDVQNKYSRLYTLTGHDHLVTSVTFSPNGKRVASASFDGTVKVWNTENGKEVWTSPEIENPDTEKEFKFQCVAFAPDGITLAAAGDSTQLFVWNTETGKQFEVIHVPEDVYAMEFRPGSGRVLALCCARGPQGSLLTLNLDDETSDPSRLQGHDDQVLDVAFSCDGGLLASVSRDGTLKIWDTATLECMKTIAHDFELKTVVFGRHGQFVGATGADGIVHIWNVDTEKPHRTIRGHLREIKSLDFSPNGSELASASTDGTTRIWDLSHDQGGRVIEGKSDGMPVDLVFKSSNRFLVRVTSNSQQAVVEAYNSETESWVERYEVDAADLRPHPHNDYAFSPDGRYLAAPDKRDPTLVRVWDLKARKPLGIPFRHSARVTAVEFGPNGKFLLSAQNSPEGKVKCLVKRWSLDSNDVQAMPIDVSQDPHAHPLRCLAMSAEGLIACGDTVNNCVHLFDEDGNRSEPIKEIAECLDVAFSRNGIWLAAADKRKAQVRTVNMRSGETHVLDAPQDVNSVCFSPDGKRLVASGYSGDVMMWDSETGMEVLLLRGFGPPPGELGGTAKVLFDGSRLASLNIDKSVNLWVAPKANRR